jgi:hypothetical protein
MTAMYRRTAWLGSLLMGVLLVVSIICSIAAAEPKPSRSLDEDLLKDLGRNPVDEIDRDLLRDGVPPARDGSPQEKANTAMPPAGRDPFEDRLKRELGPAAVSGDENPLVSIARRMHEVENRIGQNDAGPSTQSMQQGIVTDLERLIQQARQAGQQQQAEQTSPSQASSRTPAAPPPSPPQATGQKPTDKPATASTQRQGTGNDKQSALTNMLEAVDKKVWGSLPPRQREQLLQLRGEEFLPQYQPLIEEYYRRLSEGDSSKQ